MALNKREKSFCVLEYARLSQHKFAITLDRMFWTRRCQVLDWPPRSPDLTPYTFTIQTNNSHKKKKITPATSPELSLPLNILNLNVTHNLLL